MGHEAEIIIPGTFVALQGTPGDGIINTVETPTTWHLDGHHATIGSGNGSGDGMDDDDDDDAVIPMATTRSESATPTSSLPTRPVLTEDSYVVIVNDTDTQDDEGQEQSPREQYHRHCLQQAIAKREEWKDSARSMATDHVFWTSSNPHHSNNNINNWNNVQEDGDNDNNLDSDDALWWLQRGKVAIMKELPTKLSNGTILRSVIGTIPPGSTVVATDICYLNSQTLQRCQVAPITSSGGTTSPPHRIYPRAKLGWLVLVKLEHHGRIGYATLSVDGYPLLAPGLPSWYTDPHCWIWRVTCPSGAYVREGLNLNTQHLDTIPFGTLVRVTKRTINTQGLSRLRVSAVVDDHANHTNATRLIDGWCSEFLNPLSGNRGSILTPLAFPVPVLYRIILAAGAVVRSNVELSSSIQRQLPYGTIVPIQSRAFSEHPVEQCLHRLQLVAGSTTTTTTTSTSANASAEQGDGGWISLKLNQRPPNDTIVVEYVSLDPNFDPDSPHLYHMAHYQRSLIQEDVRGERGDGELSSIDSEAGSLELSAWSPLPPPSASLLSRKTTPTTATTSATTTMASQCVICLTHERNATIVHGETGHVACCLACARILKARGDKCPVCRLPIDLVIQQFWA